MIYYTRQAHHRCPDSVEGYTDDALYSDDLGEPGGDLRWIQSHCNSPHPEGRRPLVVFCPFCGESLPTKAPLMKSQS